MSRHSLGLVQGFVARWGTETPNAIALTDGSQSLSFAELDRLTNRFARKLIETGARPEDVIGVFTGRCMEMVTSVVAINKAGAAYCPLDPTLPADRLAFMVASARARMVVTTRALWAASPIAGVTPLFVDDPQLLDAVSDAPVDVAIDPQNLAYVIYTSGSTGRPKGIEMPHWLLTNLLRWHVEALPRARTAQYASFFFDVSFQDIYGALAAGSTLIVIPEELRVDFHNLCGFLEAQRAERIFVPVVTLIGIAEAIRAGAPLPASLRDIVAAGEQLKVTSAVRELFDKLGPAARLYNHYGPAETHLTHAAELVPPAAGWPELPHIGTAIRGPKVYLLDENLAPVAAGQEGSIFIGGTVSRGYRGRPDLTAERFLPDPFAEQPGARMYRTGDLAVLRPDGNYEFRGRADFQVKIRGFRVEPEEIENTLVTHPAVSSAAVVAVKDRGGSETITEQRLLAFIVLDPRAFGNDEEARHRLMLDIRRFAQQRLANYMVPAFFTVASELPLTPSGKLDRKTLRDRAHEVPLEPQTHGDKVEPRNAVETILVEAWREVLDIDDLSVTDDFFMLGGDSLRVARLIAQVRDLFETQVSFEEFFDSPTIEGLHAIMQRSAPPGTALEARAELLLRVAEMSDEEVESALGSDADGDPPADDQIVLPALDPPPPSDSLGMSDGPSSTRLLSRDELSDLNRRSNLKGLVRLFMHFAILAGTSGLIYLTAGSPLRVLAILLHGVMIGSLLCPLHESVHGAAFRSRRLNDFVASLCGLLILNPASMFRTYHFKHHRYTSVPDKDPEFNVFLPKTKFQYLVYISGWMELKRIGRVLRDATRSVFGELRFILELRILFVGLLLLVAGMIYFQTLAPLYYWVLPMIFGTIVLADIQGTEHAGCPIVPDMLQNTRTTLTNPIMRFILWNMSYHAEHHSFPSVPFHALPHLHRKIAPKLTQVERSYAAFHWRVLVSAFRKPAARPSAPSYPAHPIP